MFYGNIKRSIKEIKYPNSNETVIEIISSQIFIPHRTMKNTNITILFRGDAYCLVWMKDDKKRYEVVEKLNHYETSKLRWIVSGDMIQSPQKTKLTEEDIIETVELSFSTSVIDTVFDKFKNQKKVIINL